MGLPGLACFLFQNEQKIYPLHAVRVRLLTLRAASRIEVAGVSLTAIFWKTLGMAASVGAAWQALGMCKQKVRMDGTEKLVDGVC